jgi:hypothetical protein
MNEKANLRKDLKSWRGRDFTEEEAKSFDISKLIGVACLLGVSNKESKGKTYLEVSSVSTLMKGMEMPKQINPSFELNYDNFTMEAFMTLPEHIRKKMEKSLEFAKIENNIQMADLESRSQTGSGLNQEPESDLPF